MWKKFLDIMYFLYLLVKPRLWSRRNYFSTLPIQSFDFTKSNNMTPTLAHVKRSPTSPQTMLYGNSDSTI